MLSVVRVLLLVVVVTTVVVAVVTGARRSAYESYATDTVASNPYSQVFYPELSGVQLGISATRDDLTYVRYNGLDRATVDASRKATQQVANTVKETADRAQQASNYYDKLEKDKNNANIGAGAGTT